jgi:hypothetical protein
VTGAMRFTGGALDDNDHAVTRATNCSRPSRNAGS